MYAIIHMKKKWKIWYIFYITQTYNLFVKKCKKFRLLFQKILALKVMMHMYTRVKDRVKFFFLKYCFSQITVSRKVREANIIISSTEYRVPIRKISSIEYRVRELHSNSVLRFFWVLTSDLYAYTKEMIITCYSQKLG